MLKITYIENGVRQARTADIIDLNGPEGITLMYKDVPNDFNEEQFRVNVLAKDTIVEYVEGM